MSVAKEGIPLLLHPDNWIRLEQNGVALLDRRQLPRKVTFLRCRDYEEVSKAIEDMVVQGAGDLAITAGYGLLLTAMQARECRKESQGQALRQAASRLRQTRPTGSYLFDMLDNLLGQGLEALERGQEAAEAIQSALRQAINSKDELARKTGEHAETLLEDGDLLMTHCFAGAGLLYMLKFAQEKGKSLKAIATETRPYLQGQRLTSFSINQLGIPVTLITDGMAAYCMSRGMVQKVFAAADRIAMDGSVANKVGTFQLALAAHFHGIPFYILGYRGPARDTPRGEDIPIEERNPEEVLSFGGERIAADGVAGYYPAFDVTPPRLISGIVTNRGIFPAHLIREYYKVG
ncbi:MAG: s-methyl-5-thioribose-1-phosphate isomerase, partial [Chloroflexi bacterium]|nr:s-methyl-5-thioribose-1-phosphate isomerase [Chloroflexota bacterium]